MVNIYLKHIGTASRFRWGHKKALDNSRYSQNRS